jgi:hypothetical protein
MMSWNPTVFGLAMDVVGFLIVFRYGGFSVGRVSIVAEDSKNMKFLKLLGAALIIAGFGLQIVGAMSN